MREIETRLPGETLASAEVLKTNFGGLTISGKSGTGKTTTMDILASFYGITDIDRLYKGGQKMRGNTNVHKKRAQRLDRDLDQEQLEFIRSANPDDPFIDEGRLAGFLATKELEINPELNVVRVLFVADVNTRVNRILKRRIERNEKAISHKERVLHRAYALNASPATVEQLLQSIDDLKSKKFSFFVVKHEERQREEYDTAQWAKVHADLADVRDVFHPALARFVINPGGNPEITENSRGPKFYDFAINTSDITVLDTAIAVNDWLKKIGQVEPITKSSISQSAVIFEA